MEKKRGRGRPPKYNEKTVRVEASIPESLEEWIDERYDSKSAFLAECAIIRAAGKGYDPPVKI